MERNLDLDMLISNTKISELEPTSAKLVYELSLELAYDLEQVSLAQALTLDETRPLIGLRGKYGLFGSEEWWRNIANGLMPVDLH